MRNTHTQYTEYIRSKKSILDVFADIGALFSTLYSVFSFIFNFYSQNFDNYKILKEILSTPGIFEIRNKRIILKANSNKIEEIPFNKKLSEINTNDNGIISIDSCKTIPNNSSRLNLSLKEEFKFKENYNNKSKGIKFIYFILENMYCKCKNIRKEYNIIDICNNILSKYSSIESILYNQIIFENLLKDYHWNDNNLKIIGNNYLIKKLKLLKT